MVKKKKKKITQNILLNQWKMDGKQMVSPVKFKLPVALYFGTVSGQRLHPASQLPISTSLIQLKVICEENVTDLCSLPLASFFSLHRLKTQL